MHNNYQKNTIRNNTKRNYNKKKKNKRQNNKKKNTKRKNNRRKNNRMKNNRMKNTKRKNNRRKNTRRKNIIIQKGGDIGENDLPSFKPDCSKNDAIIQSNDDPIIGNIISKARNEPLNDKESNKYKKYCWGIKDEEALTQQNIISNNGYEAKIMPDNDSYVKNLLLSNADAADLNNKDYILTGVNKLNCYQTNIATRTNLEALQNCTNRNKDNLEDQWVIVTSLRNHQIASEGGRPDWVVEFINQSNDPNINDDDEYRFLPFEEKINDWVSADTSTEGHRANCIAEWSDIIDSCGEAITLQQGAVVGKNKCINPAEYWTDSKLEYANVPVTPPHEWEAPEGQHTRKREWWMTQAPHKLFVTLQSDIIQKLRQKGETMTSISKMHERIFQLLGLNSSWGAYNYVVQFQVQIKHLVRPCNNISPYADKCPQGPPNSYTESFIASTRNDTGLNSAPFTAMGYTYDIAHPKNPASTITNVFDSNPTITPRILFAGRDDIQGCDEYIVPFGVPIRNATVKTFKTWINNEFRQMRTVRELEADLNNTNPISSTRNNR